MLLLQHGDHFLRRVRKVESPQLIERTWLGPYRHHDLTCNLHDKGTLLGFYILKWQGFPALAGMSMDRSGRRGGQDLFLERHSRPLEQTSAFAGNYVDRRPTRGRHLVWPRGLNFLCRNRCAPAARPGFTESLDKLRLFPRDFEATLTQLFLQQRDCEGVQVQVCATTAHAPHEEAACDYLR